MNLISTRWEPCLLLLYDCCFEAPECRGKSRSSMVAVVASYSCGEVRVPGGEVDRRVLVTDIDAELGLITCVFDRIGQFARHSTPGRSGTDVSSDSSQWCR